MANTKEIKMRMDGIRETQKITNAMYLIASTKMKRAKEELNQTRPYFNALKKEIRRVFAAAPETKCKFFEKDDADENKKNASACLVITADKGLAGAYNQNVIREAEKLLQAEPDVRLFVVGEYGRQYFKKHNIEVDHTFQYTAQNPTLHRAREISAHLLELYEDNQIGSINIIYTDWKNGMSEEVSSVRLLPFSKEHFSDNEVKEERQHFAEFGFFPSAEAVLYSVMPNYISGFIYSALVTSYCSEQNARMNAMNSANQNAEKILEALSIEYNRVRQAAITQEITEISAGAQGQKKAKEVLDFE